MNDGPENSGGQPPFLLCTSIAPFAPSLTHASLTEVGRTFGGKDHTTVLHAVEKIQGLLQDDPKFKKTIDTLTQSISL